jgi:hypothetical protein
MKNIIFVIVGLLIGAGAVWLATSQQMVEKKQLTGPIQYNCELSAGSFKNGACECPIGEGQTQDMMYDKNTGFCQSDIGGPSGDAFPASIGLPYGDYGFYQDIIFNLCENSGGSLSGAACICDTGNNYDKATGQCK